ncbi:ribbon-helix-helix domain-containing protein [Luteipulveratus flavus]|uniref:Ribbon-helix-helix domain-containing protein n=1 Tax=Luteipulveratus flavus TaxID=3031728 RepID=A0ABT6C6T9_9MICO|nr:ribbon-helix-helix domain-containing protein [Luteipulveratus sp. YIM 133296]MDF8264605.1 ribbon-helix-helix domain-containing protein [Luteipulveratus sp. YIM 133296]
MKLSVSLPDDEVEFLDAVARAHSESRSAVLLRAVRLLRARELEDSYAEAFSEWHDSGEGASWHVTAQDGLR